ncbi:LOW QUALITY PROTEIN: heat shock factor protein 5 [Bufo bufo]|uniref:LOW QUALITY PROTEIN: heat shock factor protein 5 n=1 Tax=Bufo bufo TaxID=8384 RepID=UPI001ABE289D|nr:LOW QUALITY PROTEIN: heat shock factor protein 5 [Bufo bufo]
MEPDESFVATPINPNNFPAKLWRLVNSPLYQSICWDSSGDGVIIDQQLFESELLCPSRGMAEATDLFKTTNFTSFIRQLNLYGFRKLCLGSGSSTGLHHPGGDLGTGDGNVHHFYNDHFQKGRPDLLVNLKRLTSTNKAKLAAGLEVTSRPPNRYQRMLASSLTEDSREDSQDKDHIVLSKPDNEDYTVKINCGYRTQISSYSAQGHGICSQKMGCFYPDLQHFPTDITYTMQSSAKSVHVQQGLPSMPGSVQRYSGYMPHPAQYLPVILTQQNRPMHPSFPMEFFHTGWPSSESSEFRKDEMNLENVFQFADELQSSSQLEIVKLDTVESLVGPAASPLQNENVAMAVRPGNDEAYCSQTDHLEPLLHADITTEALLVDQPHNCTSPLTSAYVCPLSTDHTEVDMNTSSDADKTLCVDEVDLLASDVLFSPSQIATCDHMHSTNGKAKFEK